MKHTKNKLIKQNMRQINNKHTNKPIYLQMRAQNNKQTMNK